MPGKVRTGWNIGDYSPSAWTSCTSQAEIIHLQANSFHIMGHHSCSHRPSLLQYAIGTLDEEVIIEVVEISYCDNAHQLNNKKEIAQLYSTVVESNHYHCDPSTRKNKDYQRNNLRNKRNNERRHIRLQPVTSMKDIES